MARKTPVVIDPEIWQHPKFRGEGRDQCLGSFLVLLCVAVTRKSAVFSSREIDELVGRDHRASLFTRGVLEETPQGLVIHDFERYQKRAIAPVPKAMGRLVTSHARHAHCGVVCLPDFLYSQFVTMNAGRVDVVDQWARDVLDEWQRRVDQGEAITEPDNVKWWQARYRERHEHTPVWVRDQVASTEALKQYAAGLMMRGGGNAGK